MARSEHPFSRAICAAIIAGAIAYFGLHLALDRHAFGVSMNAQQEAVALYLHWEKRGKVPSIRSIGRALRDQGMKVREETLYVWLHDFREASRKRLVEKRVASGKQKSPTAEAIGQDDGKRPEADGMLLRAHSKVSLVSDSSLSPPTAREAAKDFAAWFCREGIAAGAIDAQWSDHRLWAKNTGSVPYAEQILAVHPRAEAERRSRVLYALKVAGKLRKALTLQTLATKWDDADVAGGADAGGISKSTREKALEFARDRGMA